MAGNFRLVQPTLKIVVSFFCGLVGVLRSETPWRQGAPMMLELTEF
jgi:hypothetical protein